MEAKPEVLRKIYPQRKDVIFYAVKFCIHVNFLSVQPLRRYEIFKNNVDHFFSLHENRDGHLVGLMEAKPEELGTIWTN